MLITKDGRVLGDPQPVSEQTMQYLQQLWKLPNKDELEQQREKLYTTDKFWALPDHRKN